MIYLILVILCFPVSVRAFISPDVVSHSISSSLYSFSLITAYFVSGVVFLLGLLTVFWKKVRKLCVFYIIVLFLFFLSFFSFFYFKYYQPLYIGFNDSLNFNISGVDNSDSLMGDSSNIDLSWEDLISMYLSKNNISNNSLTILPPIDPSMIINYGIDLALLEYIDNGNVYYIDVREDEEFKFMSILNSVNIRSSEITKDLILSKFSIDEDVFNNSLFVLYCMDGIRSSFSASRIGLSNVRFIPNFKNKIKTLNAESASNFYLEKFNNFIDNNKKNIFLRGKYGGLSTFYLSPQKADTIINNKKTFIYNGMVSVDDVIGFNDSVYSFVIPYMDDKEYDNAITQIIGSEFDDLIIIIRDKSELYFAKMLFYRLEKEYGVDFDKFHFINYFEWKQYVEEEKTN